ncbi:uncharacterized protein [Triticum aestivum]|uniref:uncharacterized protein n=1 Tax=Triticum aestivum TaxID=4565 RepID=UPI001D00A43C|nr:uncharacterized protein LOC123177500 [Triticum aestivum]
MSCARRARRSWRRRTCVVAQRSRRLDATTVEARGTETRCGGAWSCGFRQRQRVAHDGAQRGGSCIGGSAPQRPAKWPRCTASAAARAGRTRWRRAAATMATSLSRRARVWARAGRVGSTTSGAVGLVGRVRCAWDVRDALMRSASLGASGARETCGTQRRWCDVIVIMKSCCEANKCCGAMLRQGASVRRYDGVGGGEMELWRCEGVINHAVKLLHTYGKKDACTTTRTSALTLLNLSIRDQTKRGE